MQVLIFILFYVLTETLDFLCCCLFKRRGENFNYLDVLDAQSSYLNAEIQHSNAIRDRYLAMIDLYKALGGGWK